jgi:preprotein translocase subunit SecF
MYIVSRRRLFFTITGIILALALGSIAVFGLPLSIDFTGGSLVEVAYKDARPALPELTSRINNLALGETSLRESGTNGVILRSRTLTPSEHQAVLQALAPTHAATAGISSTTASSTATSMASTTASSTAAVPSMTELRFNSIGPSLGSELAKKALWALVAVIAAIMFYIAWAFRQVSRPVSSWVYGFIVVVILFHDVIVPAGFYALLCHFTGAQVDSLFAVALLAILGYSVNDTIVIFDRVREHLHYNDEHKIAEPFEQTVGKSIRETLGRSINTSLTIALALLALVFFGAHETINFALVLLVGVIAGTYSSILLAAPLLVPLAERYAKPASTGKGKKK